MFTLINKDVVPPIFLFPFLLFLFVPGFLTAKGGQHHPSNFADTSDSYENYMPRADVSGLKSEDKQNRVRESHPNHFITYKVRRGDTITKISRKFKVPLDHLCAFNGMGNNNSIMTGMQIKIPTNRKLPDKSAAQESVGTEKSHKSPKPLFRWPLPHIIHYKRDEMNGVRPIGIVITSTPGSSVLSSATGIVKKIGRMRGFGRYVVISHPGRYATVYANLGDIFVSEGEKIFAGNIIGKLNGADSKIHFQIDFEGKPEDPLPYLSKN